MEAKVAKLKYEKAELENEIEELVLERDRLVLDHYTREDIEPLEEDDDDVYEDEITYEEDDLIPRSPPPTLPSKRPLTVNSSIANVPIGSSLMSPTLPNLKRRKQDEERLGDGSDDEMRMAETQDVMDTAVVLTVVLRENGGRRKSTRQPVQVYKSPSVFSNDRRTVCESEFGTAKEVITAAAKNNSIALTSGSYNSTTFHPLFRC